MGEGQEKKGEGVGKRKQWLQISANIAQQEATIYSGKAFI
jgi:hypothetical protein